MNLTTSYASCSLWLWDNCIHPFLSSSYILNYLFPPSGPKKKQLLIDKPDDDAVINKYDTTYDEYDDFM